MNRETWLEKATSSLTKQYFTKNGYEMPKRLQVSVGFAKGSRKAIGQCWPASASEDTATVHIFLCPTQADTIQVLGVLLHELIHASGCKGHKGEFRKRALEFGLEGKMTATFVGEHKSDEPNVLRSELEKIQKRLGDYPHVRVTKMPQGNSGSGWVRMQSPEEPTYTVVVSPKSLENYGPPVDPWGNEMVEKGQ